jgi:CDP-paratose synthetase
MNILITGATGYLGQNLTGVLLSKKKYKIGILVRSTSVIPKNLENQYSVFYIDDTQLNESIKNFNPEVVIHLGAFLTSSSDKSVIDRLIGANITFGTHLLDSLKDAKPKLFINTGTFAEYHFNDGMLEPTYLYSATKTAFRSILKYYAAILKFKTVNIIPYSIYGNEGTQKKIIDILFDSINSKSPLKLSKGEQKLDFIHIDDVISFYLSILENYQSLNKYEEFALGTGNAVSIRDLASIIEGETGETLNVEWGAVKERERDSIHSIANIAKNIHHLGWKPKVSIIDGIREKISQRK